MRIRDHFPICLLLKHIAGDCYAAAIVEHRSKAELDAIALDSDRNEEEINEEEKWRKAIKIQALTFLSTSTQYKYFVSGLNHDNFL